MKNWIIFGVLELISLLCLINLWRRKDTGVWPKLFWSFVILMPFIGPIFYGGFFQPPGDSGRKGWPSDRGGMPAGGEIAGPR